MLVLLMRVLRGNLSPRKATDKSKLRGRKRVEEEEDEFDDGEYDTDDEPDAFLDEDTRSDDESDDVGVQCYKEF